jgi:hypothetical protein
LIRAGVVVYVGQTLNIFNRLGGHVRCVQFDAVEFYACAEADLNAREECDLARLRPELNRIGVDLPYRGPPGRSLAIMHADRIADRDGQAA